MEAPISSCCSSPGRGVHSSSASTGYPITAPPSRVRAQGQPRAPDGPDQRLLVHRPDRHRAARARLRATRRTGLPARFRQPAGRGNRHLSAQPLAGGVSPPVVPQRPAEQRPASARRGGRGRPAAVWGPGEHPLSRALPRPLPEEIRVHRADLRAVGHPGRHLWVLPALPVRNAGGTEHAYRRRSRHPLVVSAIITVLFVFMPLHDRVDRRIL